MPGLHPPSRRWPCILFLITSVNFWTTQHVTSQKTVHFIDTAVRTSDPVDDKRSVERHRYRGDNGKYVLNEESLSLWSIF
jgi:hypothetical protein